ncbi:glycosyltransferase [bacterium]|nr:glycosyltransferase [bacterium]
MTNNAQPLVTVAIPTYNRADSYLKQTIESVLDQTYKNIEVIIADNCSSDQTDALVESLGAQNIRYFKHQTNIGPNNNFNFCLKQANGDYFLLLQDDDLIDPDMVEVCIKAAENSFDVGIIRTGTRVINATGRVLRDRPNRACGLPLDAFFVAWFKSKTALYLCSTLFHTERLKAIGGFKSKHNLFQDVMAEVKLAAEFGRIDVCNVKASFRKHDAELTFKARVSDWCEDSFLLLDLMCQLVPEKSALIRNRGLKFFAKLNYRRARDVKSPSKRFLAYIKVFRKFNYRYLPPYVYNTLSDIPLYRFVLGKRKR